MSAALELIHDAHAAGLTLTAHQGKLVLSGRRPPAPLLSALREHKAEILTILTVGDDSQVVRRQRWGRVPEEDLPLDTGLGEMEDSMEGALLAYVGRMPPEVGIWLARRAVAYREQHAGLADRQAMVTAAVDLVLWQQPRMIPTPDAHLRGQAVGRFLDLHIDHRP